MDLTNERQLELAERLARQAHAGQRDTVTGGPYIDHVTRVVAHVDSVEAKIVAWLHDVVEDSPIAIEDLRTGGFTDRIVEAVELLTRIQYSQYRPYIQLIALSGNRLAIDVKLADLRDHLRPNCPERLRGRYEEALMVLEKASV